MSYLPVFLACEMMAVSVSVKYLKRRFCRSTGMPRILARGKGQVTAHSGVNRAAWLGETGRREREIEIGIGD